MGNTKVTVLRLTATRQCDYHKIQTKSKNSYFILTPHKGLCEHLAQSYKNTFFFKHLIVCGSLSWKLDMLGRIVLRFGFNATPKRQGQKLHPQSYNVRDGSQGVTRHAGFGVALAKLRQETREL